MLYSSLYRDASMLHSLACSLACFFDSTPTQALITMSSSRVSQHIARISHDALLGGGLITSSSTTSCSRAFLRDGIQLQLRYQARHRQYSSIARSSILESQKPSSGDTLIRLRWSNSKNGAGGGSGSNRYGGGRHYHHSSRGGSSSSSSRKASPIQGAKWLLLPFSLSKIHLDEDHTLKERAQEFYEHARDLTLNEKSSLLEEGDHELSLWDRFLTSIHRWIIEPLGTARRFLYLAFLFLPVIATAPLLALELSNDQSSGSSSKRKKGGHPAERATTRWWYGFLVKQMERAGPTFIKVSYFLCCSFMISCSSRVLRQLAQWAGSRRDLFPDILCDMFGRLHSNGKAHSLRYTKRVLEKAFNKPFDEIFSEFDEKPMGIGAIAQVRDEFIHYCLGQSV
jgi:hypothetical protein